MKRLLIFGSFCLLFIAIFAVLTYANTGMHFMRIGRLWVNAEYDGAEGWMGEYAWPGGYLMGNYTGIRELWGGNVRKTGTLAGCKDWTGPNGKLYPYWTSGMYRTYDYNYSPYWVDQSNQTALLCVTQILVQRWPQPNVFVNGKSITPDGGDNFLDTHQGDFQHDKNTAIDPKLITERAIKSVWRYTMGVELERWLYSYSTPKHQDYTIMDIKLTNNGKVFGLPGDTPKIWPYTTATATWPYIIQNQKVKGFWWAWTCNPWTSRVGRDYSISSGDDEVGEFVTPFASQGNNRRFFLFYDGDKPGDSVKDFGDPSKDERWIEILSPAWICQGALYADKSGKEKVNDNAQPNCTVIQQERDYDLGRVVKTYQDQYEAMFQPGKHWQLDTPHRQIAPNITIPSGYTCFGPYDLDFNESINISYVIAAGGMSKDLCIKYGKKAWTAKYTGAVMDTIETLFKTGRDSVYKALRMADWNVNGAKAGSRKRYDVPDPPRPPANLWVASEGPKIKISWSDESRADADFDTGVKDFKGYRVYRATGARDSVYRRIYDGTANEYLDSSVTPGIQYFYYVVAYDDGSQNWQDTGVSLESGRWYCWTGWAPNGVQPKTEAITDASKLNKIRVVPNPYSAAGKKYPGEMDKIVFTGLPGKCTIRIYSSNGNFVHKIEHNDGAGKEDWDLRTEFNQYIVSDVYIYTVESDMGKYVDKFIVVR
jgi:hypothetical protein